MRAFSRSVFLSLFVLAIAGGAGASEFIAIADVETGRALVPEGTVVPAGVRFFVVKHGGPVGIDGVTRERVPLVFAYAPESKFVKARKDIAAARAVAAPPAIRYFAAPESAADRVT